MSDNEISVKEGEVPSEKFALTCLVLAETPIVLLGKELFSEITQAQNFWVELVTIEEKYDALVENYYEFEQEILQIAARHMLFTENDDIFWNQTGIINRRLLNLLASTTMYLDHTRRHFHKIFGRKSSKIADFEEIVEEQKAASLGFQVLEHIRNFSQHAGYPVNRFTVGSSWKEDDQGSINVHNVHVYLDEQAVAENTRSKNDFNELFEQCKNFRIQDLMRQSMEGLNAVHEGVRSLTSEKTTSCRDITEAAIAMYQSSCSKNEGRTGLAVAQLDDSGNAVDYKYILDHQMKRIDAFRLKNQSLIRLKDRRVTS